MEHAQKGDGGRFMENSIFRYILRYSGPQQLYLIAVTIAYYPFLFMSLELPKIIVNEAIGGEGPPYVMPLFGTAFHVNTTQIHFLLTLSFCYLFLVLVNGCFKYHINVYKGQLGERLLRRLRYQLYARVLRFPLARFRKVGQGEVIPIITAEVEPLGGFIGTAFVDVMFYGGQLAIILGFILLQDVWLGLAAIAFYPLQIYLIPKLQRRVNMLAKQRIQNVRRLSDHIGESVSGIVEIHANDTAQLELSRFTDRLGRIFHIRYEIYRRKFFIKFLNNFIDKLTPFFFFSIGGYLVIQGDLTLGALIAVLAAYKDLAAPWKELLVWYQQREDVRIKYEQVIEQFHPPGMLDEALQSTDAVDPGPLEGDIAINVSLSDEDGHKILDGAAFTVPVASHVAIVGDPASGKSELAMLLARLFPPSSGRISIGAHDLARLPESVTGRRIGYVGANTHLHNASIGENLLYGLKHLPAAPDALAADLADAEAQAEARAEATWSGNSPYDYAADWVDYAAAGVSGPAEIPARLIAALRVVKMDEDVYGIGLRGCMNPSENPEIAQKILQARATMRDRTRAAPMAALVERFEKDRYNGNATVGENLLFGAPLDDRFDMDRLAEHPYVRRVLDRAGLTNDFVAIGLRVAETMVELFADLPSDHEFFQQYSFISAEELPDYRQIIDQATRGVPLSDESRLRLLSLPFMLITERHRLGLIDPPMQERILEARHAFADGLPPELEDSIAFFDEDDYNPAATIQDNILFGKLAHGQAYGARKIGALVREVVESLDLRDTVIEIGLRASVGIGGSRLSIPQRQKLALGRAVLKRPDILIVNEAAEVFDQRTQEEILENMLEERRGQGLVWVMNRIVGAEHFDQIVVMDDGKVAEQGSFKSLAESGKTLNSLLRVA